MKRGLNGPFSFIQLLKIIYMVKINIIIFLSFFILKCSSKNKVDSSNFNTTYYISGKLDPCDCNNKSVDLINRSIETRKLFSSIQELKSDKEAKNYITEIAKTYVKLAEQCFHKNAAKLYIPSDCNDVRYLEDLQKKIFSLGIRLNQGAKVWK